MEREKCHNVECGASESEVLCELRYGAKREKGEWGRRRRRLGQEWSEVVGPLSRGAGRREEEEVILRGVNTTADLVEDFVRGSNLLSPGDQRPFKQKLARRPGAKLMPWATGSL